MEDSGSAQISSTPRCKSACKSLASHQSHDNLKSDLRALAVMQLRLRPPAQPHPEQPGHPGQQPQYHPHDSANQLLLTRSGNPTSGPVIAGYIYDANGSLTRKCTGSTIVRSNVDRIGGPDTQITSLSHDSLDRVTQVTKTGLPGEVYAYDNADAASSRPSTAPPSAPPVISTMERTFTPKPWPPPSPPVPHPPPATHGPNTDKPLLRQTGTGPNAEVSYYHQDGLGSVVAQTSPTGTLEASQRTDAWGTPQASSGTLQTYGYTGREPDATGLIYYRAGTTIPACADSRSATPSASEVA